MPLSKTKSVVPVRALLLSSDIEVIEFICHFGRIASIHVETCCDGDLALRKLCHSKFEGIIVDLGFCGGIEFLHKIRTLTSNKSAVTYAILNQVHEQTDAFQAGANFVLERPLLPAGVSRVFKASYPMMVREKRRYFRCPVQTAVVLSRPNGTEVRVTSFNVSENGICLNSAQPLQVGDKLKMRFQLPGNPEPLTLTGDVCWSETSGRVGVQFCRVTEQNASVLRDWLAQKLEENLLEPAPSVTEYIV